jgi:crotonobetainyl-CoA:carnitine CoA-transferase CaiB-like acyl-CoA transferase
MTGALSGLLVVAIEQAVAAPLCTLRLADAGARVIKIERPDGDTARHYDKSVKGTSAYFAWLNRGKESVVLDLKDSADLDLAHRMAARADVFVQNLAPGAAARLGLGSRELTSRYPRLIAVDILGYGQDTACRNMRAYDLLVQAESGICAVTGAPDMPAKVGVSIADIGTGMNAHGAILEALIARQRSGRGQAIEVAMFDAMADWMSVPLLHLEQGGQSTGRHGLSHAAIHPYAPYRCRDGEIVIAIQNPAEWRRLCAGVLRRPDLIADPRYADNPGRVANRAALDREIAPVFAGWSRAEAIEQLDVHQIAWGRVTSVEDLSAHPALRRIAATLPDGSNFNLPRPAGRGEFAGGAVPSQGAHTERIRKEFGQ